MPENAQIVYFLGPEVEIHKMFQIFPCNRWFLFKGPKNVISEHFQTWATLKRVENYYNIILHVKYEIWLHEDLKMREKIKSRSKFQL